MIGRSSITAINGLADRLARRLGLLSPAAIVARGRNEAARKVGLGHLASLSRGGRRPMFSRILVDGQWDNANYWLRYGLFRNALGLENAVEVGILGQFNQKRCREAFAAFGVTNVVDFGLHAASAPRFLPQAQALLSATHAASDIHSWVLPGAMPPALIYDGILKRQRRGDVDLAHNDLPSVVAEALSAIDLAVELLDRQRPDLVVLSHMIDFTYGSLAWAASSRGIPVVALYGDFGTNRFIRMLSPGDVFAYPARPELADEIDLAETTLSSLVDAGNKTLGDRVGGNTSDISAIYAFRRRDGHVDRDLLAQQFGWDPNVPVIAVYAPNWFDYPNGSGRFPFRDFRDWADVTLALARETPQANWLFKAHPCDEWYGTIHGARLADLLATSPRPHVRLCETSWNGRSIIELSDGLITVHGTAGMEAPFLGTPVLLPYAGWYGPYGFAQFASDADDYKRRLRTRWWESQDKVDIARRASAFAGWYLSAPEWHNGWFLADDSNQDAIWWDLEAWLKQHAGAIEREISEIRGWIEDGHRYFQVYKLLQADGFVAAGPRSIVAHSNEDPRRLQLSGGAGK